jgi:hypothetical protein
MLSIRDSSVGIAKGYGLDDRGSNPGRGKVFLSFRARKPALGPRQLPLQLVLGMKSPGCEADHSPPSSVEVKNGGAIPPLSYMFSWHNV